MATSSRLVKSLTRARMVIVWSIALLAFLAPVPPSAASAQEIVLTVGIHGTYPTIQAAVDDLVSGWVNHVRIEEGLYEETVVITSGLSNISSGEAHLSGGWNATFTGQVADPWATTINAAGGTSCLRIEPLVSGQTTISLSNLELSGGWGDAGGGIRFVTSGQVRLEISDCVLFSNYAINSNAYGGGLYAVMMGSNALTVRDSLFWSCSSVTSDGSGRAYGGGAYVEVNGPSGVIFERVTFSSNRVASSGTRALGGGLLMWIIGGAASVTGCTFDGNYAAGDADTDSSGLGMYAEVTSYGWAELRRNVFVDNFGSTNESLEGTQLELRSNLDAELYAGDTLVITGTDGIRATAADGSDLHLTNLTVADNTGLGLSFVLGGDTPTASLQNSILYGNGSDITLTPGSGTILATNNLVGTDPFFVDPVIRNYRLDSGSPAENAGTNAPLADLGASDCDGALRVIDGVVDVGAYEGINVLFSDGFELSTRRWSTVVGG